MNIHLKISKRALFVLALTAAFLPVLLASCYSKPYPPPYTDGSQLSTVTDAPTVTNPPSVETDAPTITEPPAEQTDAPIITEPPTNETDAPIITDPPAEETDAPTVTEAPAGETPSETIKTDFSAMTIDDILASMSQEEKVGQLFLARCPADGGAELLSSYKFGGYILFAINFDGETPETVKVETDSYQSASKYPMLIAVDEEGGSVNRVSKFKAFRSYPFQSPRQLYTAGGWNTIEVDTIEKAKLLLSLGINVNLAPVCDLSDDENDFIYYRSIGDDPEFVSTYIKTVVTAMNNYSIGCSLKHFPGYGPNADAHTDLVHDSRPYETFINADFLPFKAGIDAGAGSVMVTHNIMECVDAELPSSISPKVHELLRSELGFTGVIITDDLAMDGIMKYAESGEAAVLAILAGNDMLCCSDYPSQYPAVLAAVQSGRISAERVDESVRRILQWKRDLGLL